MRICKYYTEFINQNIHCITDINIQSWWYYIWLTCFQLLRFQMFLFKESMEINQIKQIRWNLHSTQHYERDNSFIEIFSDNCKKSCPRCVDISMRAAVSLIVIVIKFDLFDALRCDSASSLVAGSIETWSITSSYSADSTGISATRSGRADERHLHTFSSLCPDNVRAQKSDSITFLILSIVSYRSDSEWALRRGGSWLRKSPISRTIACVRPVVRQRSFARLRPRVRDPNRATLSPGTTSRPAPATSSARENLCSRDIPSMLDTRARTLLWNRTRYNVLSEFTVQLTPPQWCLSTISRPRGSHRRSGYPFCLMWSINCRSVLDGNIARGIAFVGN